MLTLAQRKFIRNCLNRPLSAYTKEDVYCYGRIVFNFQINTTVDHRHPFSSEVSERTYEDSLAEYFCGSEADVAVNGGGLVIVRGATGSGKTTAIARGIELARKRLLQSEPNAKLIVIPLEFNGYATPDTPDDDEQSYRLILWRRFATEMDKHLRQYSLVEVHELSFLQWLESEVALHDPLPSIFRFFQKNRAYLDGIATGDGVPGKSVDDLRAAILDDWRNSFDRFSDEEVAIYKIAQLKYRMQVNPEISTHRAFVVDNVDHLSPSVQRMIVDVAIWISEILELRLLIAVRPLTWENQHGHRTLELEEHKSPSVADVVCRRLGYIAKYECHSSETRQAVNRLIRDIRDEHSHLRNFLYATSGAGVRAALRNFGNFLSSNVPDTVRTMPSAGHILRPSDLARAFFMGPDQVIDHQNIDDLFAVNGVRSTRLALLKPRILDLVGRARGGRATLAEVIEFCQDFEYPVHEIRCAIDELLYRKRSLLWSNSLFELKELTDIAYCAILGIAPMGSSYLARLYGEYLYTEVCLASNGSEVVSMPTVLQFSKDLIIEDEKQIEHYVAVRSSADYYQTYGLESPAISFIYWQKFEKGLESRQRHDRGLDYDPAWETRIRAKLEQLTKKNYMKK